VNRRQSKIYISWSVAAIILSTSEAALAFSGENHLAQAKLDPAQAREVALKAYPGKLVSEELEQETGGSGLRYSFVIRHNSVKHEVGVDAITGLVLENSVEGEKPD
jgi:uncharacterized membrane protein YkoI